MADKRARRLVTPGEITRLPVEDLVAILRGDRPDRVSRAGQHHYRTRRSAIRARAARRRTVPALRTAAVGLSALVLATLFIGNQAVSAATQRSVRASARANGTGGNGTTTQPKVAANRPTVMAFTSTSTNLIADAAPPAGPNPPSHVYVNDAGTLEEIPLPAGFVSADSPSISADGSFVSFSAVAAGGPSTRRVYVRDRGASSTASLLTAPKVEEQQPSISPDGGFVAFVARDDSTKPLQVWLVDRSASVAKLASTSDGTTGQGNADSTEPAVSTTGAAVVFSSLATNLIPTVADTNAASDVFLATNVLAGPVALSELSATGSGQADGPSFTPTISSAGDKVAFQSFATNLISGDTNGTADVFIRDVGSAITSRISTASDGAQSDGFSGQPTISGSGRYVGFSSTADNLVAGDTNASGTATGATPTNFGLIDGSGVVTYGTNATASSDGTRVNVNFPTPAVTSAARATVSEGAVIDAQLVPLAPRYGRSNANPIGNVAVPVPPPPPPPPPPPGPRLVSVAIAGSIVTFCFDAAPTITDATGFLLQGYNSEIVAIPTGLAVSTNCVAGTVATDTTQFTVGVVRGGAVADASLRPNAQESVAVAPTPVVGPAGRTTAPDLVSVAAIGTNGLDYTFDETLGSTVLATKFGYAPASGVEVPGASATISGAVAHVLFSAAVTSPTRFFVTQGAVTDLYGEANPTIATGSATSRPDLLSVIRSDPPATSSYAYTFDEPVKPNLVLAGFELYAEDGTRFTATNASVSPTNASVVLTTFDPSVGTFTLAPPLAAVRSGTVLSLASATGTTGSATTSASPQPTARTDGPDLLAVDTSAGAGVVTFIFDEAVRDVQLSPRRGAPAGVACVSPCPPASPPLHRDVFVHDISSGKTARVSLDSTGAAQPGDSAEPTLSADGRYAGFSSLALLVPEDSAAGNVRDAFERDLLEVTVSPTTLTFNDPQATVARIGARTAAPGTVTITNSGFGRLDITNLVISGDAAADYQVTNDTCSANALDPQGACQITVQFSPHALGARNATLAINDNALGSPQLVALQGTASTPPTQPPAQNPFPTSTTGGGGSSGSGGGGSARAAGAGNAARGSSSSSGGASSSATTSTTAPPAFSTKLTAEPNIAEQGSVTVAVGTGFPPNTEVKLTWSQGIGTTIARSDGAGAFRASVLVFPSDRTGTRVLYASTPNTLGTAVVLVVPSANEDASFIVRDKHVQ